MKYVRYCNCKGDSASALSGCYKRMMNNIQEGIVNSTPIKSLIHKLHDESGLLNNSLICLPKTFSLAIS